MRHVFVNADDFGLHEDINRAIAAGVRHGRIQGVSVSTNGTAVNWPLLAELSRDGAEIGAHLTWADEVWLTCSGGLTRGTIAKNLLTNPVRYAERLRDEARAQIELLLKHDLQPSHLDSHQHIHVLPALWSVTIALAREYSISRVRVPVASSSAGVRKTPGGLLLQALSLRRHREAPGSWPCAGIARSGHNTSLDVRRELPASTAGVVELIVHPAFATDSLRRRYHHWGYDWEAEYEMLMSDEWPNLLHECGFAAWNSAR